MPTHVYADFNGDGRSDFLTFADRPLFTPPPLPHPDGTVESVQQFLSNANGSFTESINVLQFRDPIPSVNLIYNAIIATGDFNGDGYADIVAGNGGGSYTVFDGSSSGKWTPGPTIGPIDTSWQIVGAGDFNGDGRSDILWRNTTTGMLSDWLANSSGGFTINDAHAATTVPLDWQVVDAGDFNGDGITDILWRNTTTGVLSDWLGNSSGGFTINDAHAATGAPTDWKIIGVGDFNGDGHSDILWRNTTTGTLSDWLGTSTGGFAINDANAATSVSTDWHIVEVGDFNGDGRSDILWRNTSGMFAEWLGQPNGSFVANAAVDFALGTNWHVLDPAVHDFV